MVKAIEDIKDKFTTKGLEFLVDQKNADEVVNMIYRSVEHTNIFKPRKYDRELIVNVCDYNEQDILMFKIKTELSDREWNNLLKSCKNKCYQLIIKKNHDEMYFSKLESK